MRQYETAFVLSPGLSEDETTSFIRQMADVVAQKKGRMIKQDIWGKRRLAYQIKKFNEGFYVFFLYEGPGDISQELERRFKQVDSVIRFLTVRKDAKETVRKKKKTGPESQGSAEAKTEERATTASQTSSAGLKKEDQ